MSKVLLLCYTCVVGVLVYQIYSLYQTRGHAASSLAVVELLKQMVVIMTDGSSKAIYYAQNLEEFRRDAGHYYGKNLNSRLTI